jgi:hypothetical protein
VHSLPAERPKRLAGIVQDTRDMERRMVCHGQLLTSSKLDN